MPNRRAFLVSLCAFGVLQSAGLLRPCTAVSSAPALKVLASTFPVFLFTREVAAALPEVSLDLLVQSVTGCPHDYSLSPKDMLRLSQAQVLVINGRGFEPFLEAPLRQLPGLKVVDAGKGLPDLSLDVSVLEAAEDRGKEHEHQQTGHGHGQASGNPHYFSSPLRAASMVEQIAQELARCLPARAAEFTSAGEAAKKRLLVLSEEVHGLGGLNGDGIVFVLQHDALSWFFHDAGLPVDCVLQVEEDEPPSAAALADLVRRIRSGGRRCVLVGEPQFPTRILDMLARETGAEMIQLDPVAAGPGSAPNNYYEKIMHANIATLRSVMGSARKPA